MRKEYFIGVDVGASKAKGRGAGVGIVGNVRVDDGQWHHIAGVYDGAKGYLYTDGKVDGSEEADGMINSDSPDVYIGENAGATGRYWSGLIDDVVGVL